MADYGDAGVTRHADGTITVEYAADLIGVSAALLADDGFDRDTHIRDGQFVLDTAGHHRYRPVRFAEGGHVIVCQRTVAAVATVAVGTDDRIIVNTAFLAEWPPAADSPIDGDGLYALSPDRRYRPVRFAQAGRHVVCERVP